MDDACVHCMFLRIFDGLSADGSIQDPVNDDDDCCVVVDGSHQRDDRRVESYQRDCVHEAQAVGPSQAWHLQG